MGQENLWINGEGNNWFSRNKDYLYSWQAKNDLPLQLIEKFRFVPKKVLDVGCGNGVRLAAITQKYSAECYGIDPSKDAVGDGKRRYPSIRLSVGVASDLKFQESEFDLVLVNFVFHWMAREKLLRAVSEIDRVLQWEGYLLIGDFLPTSPCRVKYHHLPDVEAWTYKQNYSELFTSSNLYHLVGAITGSHMAESISADAASDYRTSYFLLQKKAEYVEVKLKP